MKKIITSILSIAMCLTFLIPSAFAADPCAAYKDVDRSKWYHNAVDFCLERGYMAGTSASTFVPNGTVTRAMAVTVIYSMAGKPPSGGIGISYNDLDAQWYINAVVWAADAGIAHGYSDTRFAPNDKVTREQLAVMFKVSKWGVPAMQWAVAKGLISGRGNKQLAPKGYATRAELAQIIYKFCLDIQDPEVARDYDSWAEAYFHYALFGGVKGTEFSFIYLDDDDIPEMINYPGNSPQSVGVTVFTFKNGKIKQKTIGDVELSYIKYRNLLYDVGGRQAEHRYSIYSIVNDDWKEIAYGTTLEFDTTTYTWNGKTVSEKEFDQNLNSIYNFDQATTPQRLSLSETEQFLKEYL